VLEHVRDDRAAMRELRRVTAPGGVALIMVPLALDVATTNEDPSITAPADRQYAFRYPDHVRLYARDISDRLHSAGFAVEVVDLYAELGPHRATRYGLLESDLIFLCRAG
jgi:SAM-dependent methyltransferase